MMGTSMANKLGYLNSVLENGVRVLVYHGMFDLVLPISGVGEALENANWTKKSLWDQGIRKPYTFKGTSASSNYPKHELMGYRQAGGGLTFVVVRNSGHMVPIDQPEWSLKIVQDFLFDILGPQS